MLTVRLTHEHRRLVEGIAKQQGVTSAEVVERALNDCLAAQVDPDETLRATFGVVGSVKHPNRDAWQRA